MKLKFICGGSGSGKTTYMINQMLSNSKKDNTKNIIFIVPEQFTLESERKIVTAEKSKTIFNIQVLSFKRLAYHIFSEVGKSLKTALDDTAKAILIRKVLNELGDELSFFKQSVCHRKGFIEKISSTISEFFKYSVSVEDLKRVYEEENENDAFKFKMKDISIIYQKYLEALNEGYVSSDETLDILAEKIPNAKSLINAEIWIDGFVGFTPQEFKIIEKLFSVVESINISLTLNTRAKNNNTITIFDPYYDSKNTVNKILKMAEENKAIIEDTIFLKENMRHKNSTELAFLEKNYFSYPIKSYDFETQNISIFAAANMYSEIKKTANLITSLVRDNNYRYSDIAVILPNQSYSKYLINTFEKHKIPFFMDNKKSIKQHPLAEIICSVMDIVNFNFSYEAVFGYLKSGFIENCNKFEISKDDIDLLENYVLANGIKGYLWNDEIWSRGFRKSRFNFDEINRIKNEVIKSLKIFELDKNKKYKVKDISKALMDFLIDIEVPKTLQKWCDDAQVDIENKPNRSLITPKEHIQVWKNIMNILDEVVKILGDTEMTVFEYSEIINAGFDGAETGFVPTSQDQVIIADFGRSRLADVKAIFVLNVNDNVLPMAKNDTGFISDLEKEAITQKGIELSPNSKRLIAQENFMAYNTLTKPREKLYLSYSVGTITGEAIKPSLIISKIKEIFEKIKIEYDEDLKVISEDDINSEEIVFEELMVGLSQITEGYKMPEIYNQILYYFLNKDEYKQKIQKIENGLNKLNPIDKLDDKLLEKLYNEDNIELSVSRIKSFHECPFSYFVKYILKVEPRGVFNVDALEVGNMFHHILKNFYGKLVENKVDIFDVDKKVIENYINDATDDSVNDLDYKKYKETANFKNSFKYINKIIKVSVLALIRQLKKGKFQTFGVEFSLEENKKDINGNIIEENKFAIEPMKIPLEKNKTLILNGQIDRIDVLYEGDKAYIKIIDYKSSEHQLELERVFKGLDIQLLTYLNAFIKSKPKDLQNYDLKPGAVLYFMINEKMARDKKYKDSIKNGLFTAKDFDNEFNYNGLANNKKEIIEGFDKYSSDLDISNTSVPAKSFVSEECLEILMEYVEYIAKETGNEMINGNINIFPYINRTKSSGKVYDDRSGCSFCEYESICNLNLLEKDDKYNFVDTGDDISAINKIYHCLGKDILSEEDTSKLLGKKEKRKTKSKK